MKRILLISLAFTPTNVSANEIQEALKNVGPAYMCGPTFKYNESIETLRSRLLAAGLNDMLAEYAIAGVKSFVEKKAEQRKTITAKDCAEKYGITG